MSPRAAWRLEGAGFAPVFDYAAGKNDWLAADLPYDGDAQLVAGFVRRDVPAVPAGQTVGDAHAAYARAGFGPVVVVNAAQVVLGVARQDDLRGLPDGAAVERAMTFGVSTVRPSEPPADLVTRMRALGTTRVVVSRSDGTLVGLFFADDVPLHHDHHHHGEEEG